MALRTFASLVAIFLLTGSVCSSGVSVGLNLFDARSCGHASLFFPLRKVSFRFNVPTRAVFLTEFFNPGKLQAPLLDIWLVSPLVSCCLFTFQAVLPCMTSSVSTADSRSLRHLVADRRTSFSTREKSRFSVRAVSNRPPH